MNKVSCVLTCELSCSHSPSLPLGVTMEALSLRRVFAILKPLECVFLRRRHRVCVVLLSACPVLRRITRCLPKRNSEQTASLEPSCCFMTRAFGQRRSFFFHTLISHEMHQQLLDRKSCWNRTYGVEKLKRVLSEVDIKSVPCESIEEFINFLPGLLEDSNFKVMFSTLQVLNLLVQKLDTCANRYFERIILVSLKALGDPRTITKNEYLNVFRQLMKTVPPQRVLDLVIGYLKHKNPWVREDVLNVIMVAILSHPEIEFDIPKLCSEVAPCLVDNKRKVRHFAFELFALFDHCLGSGQKLPFINAVEKVEKNEDAEGLMAAVEARRARHALPKLSSDGTLEYGLVLVIPRQRGSLYFASEDDMDWVMDGPRVSSARSHRSKPDSERLHGYGSLGSLTDDLPPQTRIASAGKGKNKLPREKSSLSSTENEPQPSNTPSGKSSQQVRPSSHTISHSN
uniref:TOG domain-containing protein n=1 Tax=Gouania willdenowi TaxID=441366 RepID=A0A8C5N5T4_GOUWI